MASSSSSGMGWRSTRPQVFINFRGADLRRRFISFLEPTFKNENINVFIDESELRGKDLDHLFVRISESKIAVVIFSQNYADSQWCLDELAKIKECMDQGNLEVIPVFYMVEPSAVKYLEGHFGESFMNLKSNYQNFPERTGKWEEALASVSQKFGLTFPESSDKTDKDFLNTIVVEVKRVLEQIAGHPKAIKIQQPEANPEGCMFNARELKISGSHNARYWTFVSISESPNEAAIEVAKMERNYYLEVSGFCQTKALTTGTKYEVVFIVKVEDTMSRWEVPAKAQLMVPYTNELQERELQFADLERNEWVDIHAGVFVAPPENMKIQFYLYQHESSEAKTGLMVKGAAIRPVE